MGLCRINGYLVVWIFTSPTPMYYFFFGWLAISPIRSNHSLRFSGHVETSSGRISHKTWHTGSVEVLAVQDKEMTLYNLCPCVSILCLPCWLAIRLSPVTPRNQPCMESAGYVKCQCSGWLCRDETLQKCSCCSSEDQTTTARCIADLPNEKYRTELDLYFHFLRRWK